MVLQLLFLLFLSLDETSAPAPPFDAPTDYNGDSDTADSAVLAVLDGADETGLLASDVLSTLASPTADLSSVCQDLSPR